MILDLASHQTSLPAIRARLTTVNLASAPWVPNQDRAVTGDDAGGSQGGGESNDESKPYSIQHTVCTVT